MTKHVHGYVKTCPKKSISHRSMGSNLQVFNKQVHGYVKTFPNERFSHRSMGSNLQVFTKLAQSRKVFHLEVNKIIIINLNWNMLKAKVLS